MGRWAQRSIRGGGPPTAAALNQMTEATSPDPNTLDVTYEFDLAATDLSPTDFITDPIPFIPTTITSIASNQIELSFIGNVSPPNTIIYRGAAPGFLTPQTLAY